MKTILSQLNEYDDIFSNITTLSYFEVESKGLVDFFDISQLKKILPPEFKKYKFRNFNPHEEQERNIIKQGLSKVINPHLEHFTGRPQTRREDYIQTLQKFLDTVLKGKSLIIIDPYIFPSKCDSDYCSFVVDILKKYIPNLSTLSFVSSSKHNQNIRSEILAKIRSQNVKLKIVVKQSEDFHDRFWISPRNRKGIFMGTSLNGLSKKYTLIDYIEEEDIREIMAGVKKVL